MSSFKFGGSTQWRESENFQVINLTSLLEFDFRSTVVKMK